MPTGDAPPSNSKEQTYLYRQLAVDIEAGIAGGAFRPGERLPSIRRLHRELNLSVSTIYQAYMELEKSGLIEARPKSGYYVKPVGLSRLPAPSYHRKTGRPRRVNPKSMVNEVVAAIRNKKLLPFGASSLSPEILPNRHFARILKGISKQDINGFLSYAPTEGEPELRRQIISRHLGLAPGTGPDDLVVTAGCTEAVALSLQAVTVPGDIIAIESPTHFGFLQLAREMGLLVLEVPANPRTGVDIQALKTAIGSNRIKACLFMPNFHNPLGALMPEDHKMDLVRLLNRHEIPLIEDDIYAELYFDRQRPSLLKSHDRKDLVITCSSFSKVLASGLRVGWVIPGRRFLDRVRRLKAGISISASSLDQLVLTRFLAEGYFDRHMRTLRKVVEKQVLRTALAVQEHFPPDIGLVVPRGGNMLWIELPPGVDGLTLYQTALENHISIVPGEAFSGSGRFTRFIRLACGFPFTREMERGVVKLGELVGRLREKEAAPFPAMPGQV